MVKQVAQFHMTSDSRFQHRQNIRKGCWEITCNGRVIKEADSPKDARREAERLQWQAWQMRKANEPEQPPMRTAVSDDAVRDIWG
jgi:hypothetical protein